MLDTHGTDDLFEDRQTGGGSSAAEPARDGWGGGSWLTPRERTFRRLLTAAVGNARLHDAARTAAGEALRTWEEGRRDARRLFGGPADADAWLACVRWGLLCRLSALSSEDAPPLHLLLARGDITAEGWSEAVSVALLAVDRAEQQPVEHPPWHGEDGLASELDLALTALGGEGTVATSLSEVENAGEEVRVKLVARVPSPVVSVEWRQAGLPKVHAGALGDAETWRAVKALVAGLYAADRMGLAPVRVEPARGELARHLAGLLSGTLDARSAIERVVERLGAITGARPGWDVWPAEPWPMAFSAVIRALDRFAGLGGDLPALPVVPGTWVAVARDDLRAVRAFGVVVEPPQVKWRLTRRGRSKEGQVAVRIGGRIEWVEPALLRTPPRQRLFT